MAGRRRRPCVRSSSRSTVLMVRRVAGKVDGSSRIYRSVGSIEDAEQLMINVALVPADVRRQPTVVPFGPDGHRRPPTIDYLAQVARAADDLGFTGVLTPTGTWCEDSWLVTAALLRETERLKFLVAFRPNSISPTLAAQKAATYPADLRRPPAAQHRHRRRGQRAAALRRLARPRRALRPHRRVPHRPARRAVGHAVRLRGPLLPRRGRHGEPGARAAAAAVLRRRLARRRGRRGPARRRLPHVGRAAGHGRAAPRPDARAGRRARADAALRHPAPRHHPRPAARRVGRDRAVPRRARPDAVAAAQAAMARSASVGQQRMVVAARRHARRPRRSHRTCGPASASSAAAPARRSSAATRRSPTGSRSTTELGFDEFILSGHPHLEEAYWFGEGVMPVLRRRGLLPEPTAPTRRSRLGARPPRRDQRPLNTPTLILGLARRQQWARRGVDCISD